MHGPLYQSSLFEAESYKYERANLFCRFQRLVSDTHVQQNDDARDEVEIRVFPRQQGLYDREELSSLSMKIRGEKSTIHTAVCLPFESFVDPETKNALIINRIHNQFCSIAEYKK